MTTVLFVGLAPETVDFSDPALPPGLTVDKVNAGIALGMQSMTDRGWHPQLLKLTPDDAVPSLEATLRGGAFDCVVFGAGLRVPPKNLPLFEALLNVVHRHAPGAAIAFNTTPQDTADAAARQLG